MVFFDIFIQMVRSLADPDNSLTRFEYPIVWHSLLISPDKKEKFFVVKNVSVSKSLVDQSSPIVFFAWSCRNKSIFYQFLQFPTRNSSVVILKSTQCTYPSVVYNVLQLIYITLIFDEEFFSCPNDGGKL